jgi:hypothetical protein
MRLVAFDEAFSKMDQDRIGATRIFSVFQTADRYRDAIGTVRIPCAKNLYQPGADERGRPRGVEPYRGMKRGWKNFMHGKLWAGVVRWLSRA